MRTFLLPAPLLFVLLLQTGSSLAVDNDFSSYPEGAQSCLYDSADAAGCSSGSSGAELNQCLCKNRNNFVYNTASCVAKKSPSDLNAVYETLSSNCAGTGVTLSVSKNAFLAAAVAATQTTSTLDPTSTLSPTSTLNPTSTPGPTSTLSPTLTSSASSTTTSTQTTSSSTNSPGQVSADSGLSTGTKIGIGVGLGFGAIVVALAAWFIWAYQRRRHSANSIDSNDRPRGGDGSSYGSAGAFAMSNESRHEYAHDNTQQGAVELAPAAWTPPARYTTPGYTGSEDKNGETAGVPLLAELGTGSETQQAAVELPTTAYLGYYERPSESRQGLVTPEGFSPGAYSQGDISPYTPSHSSDSRAYR
ncbi:hypothetical protein E0Z10_g7317 [Xylaria hypoxylon]|uniref:CFEM domain-containing protein n=1 Tax=Xylaria hypoxylon TaxID=37992 RepID=A0A4Z0YN55_9PEZI|nr:hypothetical protein E0Z10_g7317 [Xylaria hypoxylon]